MDRSLSRLSMPWRYQTIRSWSSASADERGGRSPRDHDLYGRSLPWGCGIPTAIPDGLRANIDLGRAGREASAPLISIACRSSSPADRSLGAPVAVSARSSTFGSGTVSDVSARVRIGVSAGLILL